MKTATLSDLGAGLGVIDLRKLSSDPARPVPSGAPKPGPGDGRASGAAQRRRSWSNKA